jgi:hypothetical protein
MIAAPLSPVTVSSASLRAINFVLHVVAILSLALLVWSLFTPRAIAPEVVASLSTGALDVPVASLLRSEAESVNVTVAAALSPRARAELRAVRGGGQVVSLSATGALPAFAVSIEDEWRAAGGSRIQLAGDSTLRVSLADAAGLLDSVASTATGLNFRTGPVQGALRVDGSNVHAGASMRSAQLPATSRVLVLGSATWESRFVIAALEESGWPVDVALSLAPRVLIGQGALRTPSRVRHSVVVLLPGAASGAISALPAFVRAGGGLIIVGEAARASNIAMLRAGAPGVTRLGEIGAQASPVPRRGLDVVPLVSLPSGSVALETLSARTTVAARRVGAGRVIQVGYDNSWLWRMAGDDDAPAAHRRWWTSLVSSVVMRTAPIERDRREPEYDTLDAAPIAALARDLGLPQIRATSVAPIRANVITKLDERWLLALAVISLLASWTLRRWRGFV